MAKIVVTGSKGFIGQHLVKKLGKKHQIIGLDKSDCDLTKFEEVKLFMIKHKPDSVIDLATLPLNMSLISPYYVAYRIYCMAINLCELCKDGVIKDLVHISSSEIYEPNTPYAAAKDAQDKLIMSYVKSFGIKARIARPFNTYGEGQTLNAVIPATIQHILAGEKPIIRGDGKQKRDFVYVDDTINGIEAVYNVGRNGLDYDITSGEEYSITDIVVRICRLMGYKGNIKVEPSREGDTKRIHGHEMAIYKCEVGIDEGLQRTIKWWKNRTSK